jgi:SAM-dependent methyltransferase
MPYFTEADARAIIRATYAAAAPMDRRVAESLYRPEDVADLPEPVVTGALGVADPVRYAALRPGETVLDVGCGAGLDTLLAARAVGPTGRVIALDMTPEVIERVRENIALAGAKNVEVREGVMERLPLGDASVDVVISNGVVNLSPRPSRALAECLRVLRPGGRIALGDLVFGEVLPEELLRNPIALAV